MARKLTLYERYELDEKRRRRATRGLNAILKDWSAAELEALLFRLANGDRLDCGLAALPGKTTITSRT